MFRSKLMVSTLSAVCLFTSQAVMSTAASASLLRASVGVHAFTGDKLVHLNFKNASSETLQIKVGDSTMSIAAGKTVDLRVPVGTKIINVDATSKHPAGELLSQVSKELSGATLSVN